MGGMRLLQRQLLSANHRMTWRHTDDDLTQTHERYFDSPRRANSDQRPPNIGGIVMSTFRFVPEAAIAPLEIHTLHSTRMLLRFRQTVHT